MPYGVILHGAEVTVPGRVPGARVAAGPRVARARRWWSSAGRYPAAEARRAAGDIAAPIVEVPPGVDTSAITTLRAAQRRAARARLGLPTTGPLVVSVSRLVPRKGMDVLIAAAGRLAPSYPDLVVAIGGEGRELERLRRQAASSPVPVTLLGRVSDEDRAGTARRGRHLRHGRAATAGWAWSRRGSASSFWRPPPPECPRSPATAGVRPRPWSTA